MPQWICVERTLLSAALAVALLFILFDIEKSKAAERSVRSTRLITINNDE
jgi:hypothetical protein